MVARLNYFEISFGLILSTSVLAESDIIIVFCLKGNDSETWMQFPSQAAGPRPSICCLLLGYSAVGAQCAESLAPPCIIELECPYSKNSPIIFDGINMAVARVSSQ